MFHIPWYHGGLFPRTNLLLLVGLCGLVRATACQPTRLDHWPGRSATASTGVVSRREPPARVAKWPEYSSLGRLALVNRRALPTNNHNPFEWNLRVRITSTALSQYERWYVGAIMPVGTSIVAEHAARSGGDLAGYYFANKTDDGWVFGAATRDGLLLPPDPGCALCHAEAPADFVFGLPFTLAPEAK